MRIHNWHKVGARRSKRAWREDTKLSGTGTSYPFGKVDLARLSLQIRDETTLDDERGCEYLDIEMGVDEARDLWKRLGAALENIGKRP